MPRDAWLIFRRDVLLSMRNPAWLMISLTQPLLYLVLFGPLLEHITASTPGFPPGSAWQLLTPALIVQLTLFGSGFAGFALLAELRSGVIDRLRVTPASRLGLLLGRVLRDAVQILVQAVLIIVVAYFAFDLRAPVEAVLLTLLIAGLLAMTVSSFSYALALKLRSEEGYSAVLNTVLMPVLLLSGIMVPITSGLAPDWLVALSKAIPFTHIVEAERAAFAGDYGADGLVTGSVVLLVMAALALFWGGRTFSRETA